MATHARSTVFRRSPARSLAVLHPAFALTGICHAMGGPLLPSLAPTFHLSDSQAGFLLFAYFGGTSLGALLCGRRHARTITFGLLALTLAALGVTFTNRFFLYPVFLLFGTCVGVPMTAVSMHAGRMFGVRSAAPLTLLNFSWSAGALLAPLLVSRLLLSHSFRAAYVVVSGAALIMAVASWVLLEEPPEPVPVAERSSGIGKAGLIALFALVTFLEVGVENTTASWLTTYMLRTSVAGAAWAAASSSLYWCGFLASRGLSSLLLLRIDPGWLLRLTAVIGIAAALVLLAGQGTGAHVVAMAVLGATLGPIFPLMMARFFAQARDSSDSRWVFALCGFGGSVLPWMTGSISAQTGSLRLGLVVIPAALLVIVCTLPLIRGQRTVLGAE